MNALLRLLACCALAGALAGCAWTPRASYERNTAMKEFPAYAGAATIYVYRSQWNRPDEQATLYMDGIVVGYTRPGTYFRIDTVPGRHVLHGVGVDPAYFAVDGKAGKVYFVRQDVIGRVSKFSFVPDELARSEITACCEMRERWGGSPLASAR